MLLRNISKLALSIIASTSLSWAQDSEGCPSQGPGAKTKLNSVHLSELGKTGVTNIAGKKYKLVGYNETKSSFGDKLLSTAEEVRDFYQTDSYGSESENSIMVNGVYLLKKNANLASCAYKVTVYNPMARASANKSGEDAVIALEEVKTAPVRPTRPAPPPPTQ